MQDTEFQWIQFFSSGYLILPKSTKKIEKLFKNIEYSQLILCKAAKGSKGCFSNSSWIIVKYWNCEYDGSHFWHF